MFKHKEKQILPFEKEYIYNIIADVESYPQFVPWLSGVQVLSSYDNIVEYALEVDFKVVKQKFSTKDIFYKPDRIEISLIQGPFKTLENIWTFTTLDDGSTEVVFEIEFEFKSKILSALFSKLFIQAQKEIISSFKKRAYSLKV